MTPRIAYIDIETTPILSFVWELWKTDVIEVVEDSYLLSFAVKWNDGLIKIYALPDYPLYKKNKKNDKELVKDLWKVFDEADIIVAHNADRFDVPRAKTAFRVHGLPPPAPFKTIDTLKIARREFGFASNRLDDLARRCGIGRKLPHQGKHTWLGCMRGDLKAWAVMKRYNKHDIFLLEGIYKYFRPWTSNHPNINLYNHDLTACPKCGSKNLIRKGYSFTAASKRQRYKCLSCKGWCSGKLEPIKGVLR